MPGGDRTGPMGMGPMTGRGAGFCAGYGMPGFMNPIPRGAYGAWGGGFWGGRGFRGGGRNWLRATGMPGWARAGVGLPAWGGRTWTAGYGAPYPTREQELETLRGQAEYFDDALAGIRKRIEELEAETDKK